MKRTILTCLLVFAMVLTAACCTVSAAERVVIYTAAEDERIAYLQEELNRKKLLILGTLPNQSVADQLPKLDTELMIRAQEAFSAGAFLRSGHLLDAMEQQDTPRWHLLRGSVCMDRKQWKEAASHLLLAEQSFPREVYPKLEVCFRETEDFQKAYEYACKQRK